MFFSYFSSNLFEVGITVFLFVFVSLFNLRFQSSTFLHLYLLSSLPETSRLAVEISLVTLLWHPDEFHYSKFTFVLLYFNIITQSIKKQLWEILIWFISKWSDLSCVYVHRWQIRTLTPLRWEFFSQFFKIKVKPDIKILLRLYRIFKKKKDSSVFLTDHINKFNLTEKNTRDHYVCTLSGAPCDINIWQEVSPSMHCSSCPDTRLQGWRACRFLPPPGLRTRMFKFSGVGSVEGCNGDVGCGGEHPPLVWVTCCHQQASVGPGCHLSVRAGAARRADVLPATLHGRLAPHLPTAVHRAAALLWSIV